MTRLLKVIAVSLICLLLPCLAVEDCQYVYMHCINCYKNTCWASPYIQVATWGRQEYTNYYCQFGTSECESSPNGPCWWASAVISSQCNGVGYHTDGYLCCEQY